MEKRPGTNDSAEVRPVSPAPGRRRIWILIIFIAGVLTGMVLLAIMGRSREGRKTDSVFIAEGTQKTPGKEDTLIRLEPLRYESPLARASCLVRYSLHTVEIRLELSSLYPMKSLLEFDINSLAVDGIQNVSVNDQSSVLSAAGLVQVNNVGDNRYIIRLRNGNPLPHKIEFSLVQNEARIYHGAVTINRD